MAIVIAQKFCGVLLKRFEKVCLFRHHQTLLTLSPKKNSKEALKSTVQKTLTKVNGSQARMGGVRGGNLQKKETVQYRHIRKIHSEKRTNTEKSVRFFFQNEKTKLICCQRKQHTTNLDLFEKQPLLVTFDNALTKKLCPSYSPDGPMLEFEVVGDRNNFIDFQMFVVEKNAK